MILASSLHSLLLTLVDNRWQLFYCAYVIISRSAAVLLPPCANLGHGWIFNRCIRELRGRASGLCQAEMIEDIGWSLQDYERFVLTLAHLGHPLYSLIFDKAVWFTWRLIYTVPLPIELLLCLVDDSVACCSCMGWRTSITFLLTVELRSDLACHDRSFW